ncbi:MAG: hypothetical protein QXI91_07710 [Candidatus Bathyarchaeia archaeon]
MTEMVAKRVCQKTMKALHQTQTNKKAKTMKENKHYTQKIRQELLNLRKTMEELHFLKNVAKDLQQYKEMIKIKKYD